MIDTHLETSQSGILAGGRDTIKSPHKTLTQMTAQDIRGGGPPLVRGAK